MKIFSIFAKLMIFIYEYENKLCKESVAKYANENS